MPFGDGTGPRGMGPMTGRGAGYCGGYGRPGYANNAPGRGFGCGHGWGGGGRGWGMRPHWGAGPARAWYDYGPAAPLPREREIDLLKAQAERLQDALQQINQRLENLEQTE